LVQLCFIEKNGQRRYKYLVLGRDRYYFVKHHSDSTKKFSETFNIKKKSIVTACMPLIAVEIACMYELEHV
jgi:hypothetical protein